MMKKRLSFLFLLIFSSIVQAEKILSIPVTGASITSMKHFDQSFVRFMKKWQMPGAAVAIVKNGKLVFARGYGYSDEYRKKVVLPYSLFRVASVSKSLTAVAIMKMIQDKQLSLNTPVFQVLNDITPIGGRKLNPRIYQITIKNLLQISSGWASSRQGGFDPMFGPWPASFSKHLHGKSDVQKPANCLNTARFMMTWPLSYTPGNKQSYINLDYCLLGLVINKIAKTPYGYKGYENYILSHILNPIGIYDMRIGSTRWSKRKWNEVRYYCCPRNAKHSSYLPYSTKDILKKNFSNGGWIASSPDIAKFIYALSKGYIIKKPYLNMMLKKPSYKEENSNDLYFTMGMKVYKTEKGKPYWVLTGSFTGTNAYVIKKSNGTVISVLFNGRTDSATLFGKFRPEIKRLLLSNKVAF
jgi:N-acyl-D-amino-acid deacylase